MTPKISIIIPVYNTETYLRECLDSVINQTLKDIEIIIVNDCSPDNSESIILEYLAKDPRIKYIKHEQNLGTLYTKMREYSTAKGEYIQSLDSDDSLELCACETIYHTLKKENADICYIGINLYVHPNKNIPLPYIEDMFIPKKLSLTHSEWLEYLVSGKLNNCICGTIIKKEILIKMLNDTKILDRIVYLDDFFQIFSLALNYPINKVIALDKILYHYRCGVGITSKNTSNDVQEFCKQFISVLSVLSIISNNSHKSSFITEDQIQKFNQYINTITQKYFINFNEFNKIDQQKILLVLKDHNLQDFFTILIFRYLNNLAQNKWYCFGQLSRTQKIKKILIVLSKKIKIYPVLKKIFTIIRK